MLSIVMNSEYEIPTKSGDVIDQRDLDLYSEQKQLIELIDSISPLNLSQSVESRGFEDELLESLPAFEDRDLSDYFDNEGNYTTNFYQVSPLSPHSPNFHLSETKGKATKWVYGDPRDPREPGFIVHYTRNLYGQCVIHSKINNSIADYKYFDNNKSLNYPYVFKVVRGIHQHHSDAINLKSHRGTVIIKSNAKISSRTKQNFNEGFHPDAIQLIPTYQFSAGVLRDITIKGESGNRPFEKYDIDLRYDAEHQGITGFDGVFINLNISDISIYIADRHSLPNAEKFNTHGISINGMRNGSISNIKLAGNAEIKLFPIRLGGGRFGNIFVASPSGQGEYSHNKFYDDLYLQRIDFSKYKDLRYAADDISSSAFSELKKHAKKITIFKDLPLDKLYKFCYEEVLQGECNLSPAPPQKPVNVGNTVAPIPA